MALCFSKHRENFISLVGSRGMSGQTPPLHAYSPRIQIETRKPMKAPKHCKSIKPIQIYYVPHNSYNFVITLHIHYRLLNCICSQYYILPTAHILPQNDLLFCIILIFYNFSKQYQIPLKMVQKQRNM